MKISIERESQVPMVGDIVEYDNKVCMFCDSDAVSGVVVVDIQTGRLLCSWNKIGQAYSSITLLARSHEVELRWSCGED